MKVVMEKSWYMRNWQKFMEFCDWSWNFTTFSPQYNQMFAFFADIKIFDLSLESLYFLQNNVNGKFVQRDGHGKSRNSQGKVMEKYTKYVGTLFIFVELSSIWIG